MNILDEEAGMKFKTRLIFFAVVFISLLAGVSKIIRDKNEYEMREQSIQQVRYNLAWYGPDEKIRQKIPEMIDRLKQTGMTYDDCTSIMKTAVQMNNRTLESVEVVIGLAGLQALSNRMK
jgi:hypothetical protein